jgi:hypothetical protein
MNARRVRAPARPAAGGAKVVDLDRRRIERALRERSRYKYVQPRVEALGAGWKVVSPNCSRNIDKQGGEIDIAWLLRSDEGGWLLHARDHLQGCWVCKTGRLSLAEALAQLCADPQRAYWV